MKNIKQLSESIGISKVSIYKAIKRDEMKPYIFKNKDNITLVNEDGEKLLITLFNREKSETINDIAETTLTYIKTENEFIKDEEGNVISVLQDELKQKNDEINSLLSIISNHQKLQATQYLTANQNMISCETIEQPETQPSKSFFRRIFKKIG